MSKLRELMERAGKLGTTFAVALLLYPIFYTLGPGWLLVLDTLLLIPLTVWVTYRAMRFVSQHSLWSLRNRLLVVYGLIGVVPIVLIIVLAGLSAWAFMQELAIYLANSELNRRLEAMHYLVDAVHKNTPEEQDKALPEIRKVFSGIFPEAMIYVRDRKGEHFYPKNRAPLRSPGGWKNVTGLMARNGHFYGWGHYIDAEEEITVIAPLTERWMSSLAPRLGEIALLEDFNRGTDPNRRLEDEDPDWRSSDEEKKTKATAIPPAMSRFDIAVPWIASIDHYDWNKPGKKHSGVLVVRTRPSAVLSSFFSSKEVVRGLVFELIIGIAVLFLAVELFALVIGVLLSQRITSAVNQLYAGTRRVIRGDFKQRIVIKSRDQLGELGESFNQMTERLERLLVIEKEKERLQTELEIAREVQSQLYPKEAPPACGLQLTFRCDPARMVSGDYYDYQILQQGKLAFAIGDVAGKGISAALLMATLQAALRAQISHFDVVRQSDCHVGPELDAASLVSKLNKQIYANTSPEKYATFFFALFDEQSCTLTYTNAGHLSPLLIRNGEVIPLDSNGTVVGAFPFAIYDESCLVLQQDDLLVCYTDGVTEPENAYGEMFGEERLIELVKKNAHENDREIVRLVMESVRSWTGAPELFDDMTLLLARQVAPA